MLEYLVCIQNQSHCCRESTTQDWTQEGHKNWHKKDTRSGHWHKKEFQDVEDRGGTSKEVSVGPKSYGTMTSRNGGTPVDAASPRDPL